VNNNEAGQYLSFTLNNEGYGVDILRVQEIRGWESVRKLPNTPDYIKGVLDLRGVVVPIVDLRMRFAMGSAEYLPTTVIIILSVKLGDDEQHLVGAVVDSVSDVLDISAADLKPAPRIGVTINNRFLKGMVTIDGRMVVLLEVDRLFAEHEMNTIIGLSG